jgi:hypothetical protein
MSSSRTQMVLAWSPAPVMAWALDKGIRMVLRS